MKDLRIVKTETEYDVALEMSFTVPGCSRLSFAKLADQEFPFVPAYNAAKKEAVFTFKAMKSMMPAPTGEDAAPPGTPDNPASEEDAAAQAKEMGKQAAKIFLSSVRYQILLGERLNPKRALIRRGNKETEVAIVRAGSAALIDIPLFAMYGEDQRDFSLVVMLKEEMGITVMSRGEGKQGGKKRSGSTLLIFHNLLSVSSVFIGGSPSFGKKKPNLHRSGFDIC